MARFFSTAQTDSIGATSGGPTDVNNLTMFCMFWPLDQQATNSEFLFYVGHGNDTGGGYGLFVHHNHQIDLDISFVANYASGLNIIQGQWNTVACTRTAGGTWQIWVNGVKSSTTSSSTPFTPSGQYLIGGRYNSSNVIDGHFQGAMAEVAFWSGEVLPDAMIKALCSRQVTPLQLGRSTLVEYHPLKDDSGAGTTERFVVKGINLTRTGTKPFPHPYKKRNFKWLTAPSGFTWQQLTATERPIIEPIGVVSY